MYCIIIRIDGKKLYFTKNWIWSKNIEDCQLYEYFSEAKHFMLTHIKVTLGNEAIKKVKIQKISNTKIKKI